MNQQYFPADHQLPSWCPSRLHQSDLNLTFSAGHQLPSSPLCLAHDCTAGSQAGMAAGHQPPTWWPSSPLYLANVGTAGRPAGMATCRQLLASWLPVVSQRLHSIYTGAQCQQFGQAGNNVLHGIFTAGYQQPCWEYQLPCCHHSAFPAVLTAMRVL